MFATNQASKPHYEAVRNYLNIHELLGNGINREVFDDHVSYHFWRNELERAIRDCREIIEYVQRTVHPRTYVELERLWDRWSKRERCETAGQFASKQFGIKLPWGFKITMHVDRDVP